jgi:hypothetical protein
MSVSLSTVHIYVEDPDTTPPGFQRHTLGLAEQNQVENEGFRRTTLVTRSQSEIQIDPAGCMPRLVEA